MTWDDTEDATPSVEMTSWPEVAAKLIALRRALRWSQRQLADRIGYTQSQVSRWESGQCALPREAGAAILAATKREAALVREMRRDERRARYTLTGENSSTAWRRPPPAVTTEHTREGIPHGTHGSPQQARKP